MRDQFTLTFSSDLNAPSLRTIQDTDSENLRAWKNANRLSFFFKDTITPEMQARWFEGYVQRKDDFMFIVQHGGQDAGCMGFRLVDGAADVYNIILGRPELGGKGVMGQAMTLMCSFILAGGTTEIGCKVLQDNPALGWYLKNGFYKVKAQEDYFELKLSTVDFEPRKFKQVF